MYVITRWQHGMLLVCLAAHLAACASPVGVTRVSADVVHEELSRNVLSAEQPSEASRNVLGQHNLLDKFEDEPHDALAALRQFYHGEQGEQREAFALAELSFLHAEETGKRSFYLTSALYAYAFLFPETATESPSPYDRRFRVACDLYNRALTEGLKSADGSEVELRSGTHDLPFGQLVVEFREEQLQWIDRRLEHFAPVAEWQVRGLRNRYRMAGIGAPLAAGQVPLKERAGFQVAPRLKVPVTALLRVTNPKRQLAGDRVEGSLELYVALDTRSVQIGENRVPLEVETTSYLAYSLHESPIWGREVTGFFHGEDSTSLRTQLASLEPYRQGRFPVVFVHGTASSPGRWAEMLNDLMNDRRINRRFQFWFFTYDTGNPIPYSAMQLRDALEQALQQVDPENRDPALQHQVVIGHSQGGLLTKMTVVETQDRLWNSVSRKPLEDMDIPQEDKDLLRRVMFVEPLPFVRRVVFIATPHRGSFVAAHWAAQKLGGMVRLPGKVVHGVEDVLTKEKEALKVDPETYKVGAVFGMTPGHPALEALAETPIDPRVTAHSIIPVKGDGAIEKGDDGVVKYKSAHIEGVASEQVIRSTHSTQANPDTIEEVRRILLIHAREWCGKEVACDDR